MAIRGDRREFPRSEGKPESRGRCSKAEAGTSCDPAQLARRAQRARPSGAGRRGPRERRRRGVRRGEAPRRRTMNILVVLAVAVVFGLLRFRRTNLLTWAIVWWAGIYVLLRFGFSAPIPSSVVSL